MLELKNINVTFYQGNQQLQAVKNANLTVEKGKICGIVGYSGAGKSTLVRVMNLLQVPTSGKVIFNGKDLTEMDQKTLRKERKKLE